MPLTVRYQGGEAQPQADVVLDSDAWAKPVIPTNTVRVRLLSDYAVYVVANGVADDPAETGAPLTPGVHHEIDVDPAGGYLHLHRATAEETTVQWSAVAGVRSS